MNCFYQVTDYGIIPDASTNYTGEINSLIKRIHQEGGGVICFPAGTYISGSIELLSNITLYLSEGAILMGSDCYDDYPLVTASKIPGWGMDTHSGLIHALNGENISITGRGTIDGRGYHWWHKKFDDRPRCVEFIGCNRVLIENVTFINSPMWTIHPVRCDNVTIQNITIENPADSPNTDGIDPESCRNVRISNCHISAGDDCIAIKAGREFDLYMKEWASENITITNCTMARGHGGVVIGSEMSGGVRNLTISNCIFQNTDRGIRVKTRRLRGGVVENLRVSNIIMEHVFCPLIINCYYPCATLPEDEAFCSSKEPQPVAENTPIFRNFFFSDILVQEAVASAGYIGGLPEMPVTGVQISRFFVSMVSPDDTSFRPKEPAMTYDHEEMLGEGFHITYAKNVRIDNATILTDKKEPFQISCCEDVVVK